MRTYTLGNLRRYFRYRRLSQARSKKYLASGDDNPLYRLLAWLWTGVPAFILKLISITVFFAVLAVLAAETIRDEIAIQPLGVSKVLSDRGFTSDVAARQLQDAIHDTILQARSAMRGPELTLPKDVPDISVPTVGLSLKAMAAYIRSFVPFASHHEVTGEFVDNIESRVFVLRVNGSVVSRETAPMTPDGTEGLLKKGAYDVLEHVRPYLAAAALFREDKAGALRKANRIIARLPAADNNVIWAKSLKAMIYDAMGNPEAAEEILVELLRQLPDFSISHLGLGFVLSEKDPQRAIKELKKAISEDRANITPHLKLGLIYYEHDRFNEAVQELRTASKMDESDAEVRYFLGAALLAAGTSAPTAGSLDLLQEACEAFRLANYLDPTLASATEGMSHVDAHFPQGPHCKPDPPL